MRFLRRSTTDTAADEPETAEAVDAAGKAYTPGKGKATPKRRDAEAKRRGPVAPPPTTMREAMKRNKELRKANPQSKAERRAATKARREAMMRGEGTTPEMNKEFEKLMEGYHDLVVSGRREVFKIEG